MTLVDTTETVTPLSTSDKSLDMLTLKEAAELHRISLATLNRHIANGSLPAFKFHGRNHVTRGDLEAAFGPVPVFPSSSGPTDEGLRTWAERVAASAPPLRPEQRDIIVSAFSAALTQH
ncbi:MAG: hypothetical protein B5766_05515 [Candidatus Lumbricidophila eiseniae]|uniref:Helix-turn-helix domain-containing protein n=1 Tax=Candidatus Lumbricidiphila eiseniae TaxID=1969409 RepID=A0A2A6FRL5_9MICO|nr:MAG: hypothetical protein B5766_05515 [Candidatus Lumbricidophila eiseniae]